MSASINYRTYMDLFILIFLILLFSASLSNRLFDWVTNPINIALIIRLFIRIIISAAIYTFIFHPGSDVRSRPLQSAPLLFLVPKRL